MVSAFDICLGPLPQIVQKKLWSGCELAGFCCLCQDHEQQQGAFDTQKLNLLLPRTCVSIWGIDHRFFFRLLLCSQATANEKFPLPH
ncbi:hypothetical protein POPTR_010G112101v4 [Populus trichocarpa]|uniref:Uncharacterized protein n=1 Tax=Populus trichocarpa TaxID=3694 RepID=A0ACC0SCT9_POPTR|nr:hypothetical protein POPTR_010G112101v4 [Populus trichocarpa]